MIRKLVLLIAVLLMLTGNNRLIANEIAISHTKGKDKITLVPEKILREFDPITVFFPGIRGPEKGGPVDSPHDVFSIAPAHPGELKWLDGKTLQFLPTIAWPPLKTYAITVKSAEFKLITLMAAPQQIIPANQSTDLDPLSDLTLVFNYALAKEKLAEMVTLEIAPLPGTADQPGAILTHKDFQIKEIERSGISDPVQYQITFNNPIGYGQRITVKLQLSGDPSISGSLIHYSLCTKPLFRLQAVSCAGISYPIAANGSIYTPEQTMDCGEGNQPILIEFTDQLKPLTANQIKQMVNFSPAVKELDYKTEGKTISLSFQAQRNIKYQLKLNYIPISSDQNRVLAHFDKTSLFFYYRQSSPFLQWAASQGILEQYGPQYFPLRQRNIDQLDVRIFKINPLNRNFWPFPDEPLAIDESIRPKGPGEEPEYTRNMAEQIKLLGSPLYSGIIKVSSENTAHAKILGLDIKPYLKEISGSNQPGTYLIGYRQIGESATRYYARLQVTDLCLTATEEENAVNFCVTSINTAKPIFGAQILIEGYRSGNDWQTVFKGSTSADGMVRFQHTAPIQCRIQRISISAGNDTLVLNAQTPPPNFVNNHWFEADYSWLDWLNDIPRTSKQDAVRKAHLFTERPVYKPEEPVHIKGYVRLRQQGDLQHAEQNRKRHIAIYAPGNKTFTYDIKLNSYGSFYLKFQEDNLPSGVYWVYLLDTYDNATLGSISFKKENYRIPMFEVRLNAPDKVPQDQPFNLTMTASYYAGGRVAGQDVTWNISESKHTHQVKSFPGFLFSSDDRFSDGPAYQSKGIKQISEVSNDLGESSISINPAAETDAYPRKYQVEVTVRGADEQTVSTSKTILSLPPFVLGLKIPRFIKQGLTIPAEMICLDHANELLADKPFHIKLSQRQWHSYLRDSDFTSSQAKYVTEVVDEVVFEQDAASEKDVKKINLPVKQSGVYILEISAYDQLGRLQKVSADLYIAGESAISWQKPKANIFATSLDKKSYQPGDTALMLLKSPFQDAMALVVVEGPKKNSYHWLLISKGQAVFELPIQADMTPSLAVHTILFSGRLPGKEATVKSWQKDRSKPATMGNTTWISVLPTANELQVELDYPAVCLPGKPITVTIRLKDNKNLPQNGEVTLWLVDRAVLALGKESPLDPLLSFIDPVYSLLRIVDTRNKIIGAAEFEDNAGGDGAEERESSLFERVTVRKNFKTVPYYNPDIQVTNGVATIEIVMPDNLTDFAVRAKATNGLERFGFAKGMVSIRLPLIIQPALPRFVRPGDTFTAGGIGRVVEGEGGSGSAEIKVTGLNLQSAATHTVQWIKNKPEAIYFQFTVPENITEPSRHEISIAIAVKRDQDSAMDAFSVNLPLKPGQDYRFFNEFLSLKKNQPQKLTDPDPAARPDTIQRNWLVTTEPALIKMLAGLNYLAAYPHGCTEQQISRVFPELVLRETLSFLNKEDKTAELNHQINEVLKYLERAQTDSGLFSVWPGSTPYVSLTAYVVEFLLQAKTAGFDIKKEMLDKGIRALKESLRTDYSYFIDGYSYTERAEALTALAKAGEFDYDYAHDLIARAQTMDLYSEAKILHTLLTENIDNDKAKDRLSKDLWSSLIFKLRQGQEVYHGLQYRTETWGGLILSSEVKTLASVARTLHQLEAANPKVAILFQELIGLGAGDGWGSTQANASALLALADLLKHKPLQPIDFQIEISADTEQKKLNSGINPLIHFTRQGIKSSTVKLLSENLTADPLLWHSFSYLPAGNGEAVKQENTGFVIDRELQIFKDSEQPADKINITAGNTVQLPMAVIAEEHLTVINPEERHYVAIQVPFAAGFEPLNPNLATSPKEAQPQGQLTLAPSYALYGDDAVTFYYDTLPKGTFHFYFRLRTSFSGTFIHPAAKAEMMYKQSIRGNSNACLIQIHPRE